MLKVCAQLVTPAHQLVRTNGRAVDSASRILYTRAPNHSFTCVLQASSVCRTRATAFPHFPTRLTWPEHLAPRIVGSRTEARMRDVREPKRKGQNFPCSSTYCTELSFARRTGSQSSPFPRQASLRERDCEVLANNPAGQRGRCVAENETLIAPPSNVLWGAFMVAVPQENDVQPRRRWPMRRAP